MKTRNQKGITLIALIITIIVMLILVGVSVSVALNTGLFKAAQGAAKNTEAHKINETKLSNGTITLTDGRTDSIQNIVNSYKGGTTEDDPIEQGPIDITNGGTTQFLMSVDGNEYIIDINTTFDQLEENSDYTFTVAENRVLINGNKIAFWYYVGTPGEEDYMGFTETDYTWDNDSSTIGSATIKSILVSSSYYIIPEDSVPTTEAQLIEAAEGRVLTVTMM